MTLSLELLAQIMLNQVAWWNDTAIAALNPSIALPNALIKLVLPSTPCSATLLITQALSLVSSDFESTVRGRRPFSLLSGTVTHRTHAQVGSGESVHYPVEDLPDRVVYAAPSAVASTAADTLYSLAWLVSGEYRDYQLFLGQARLLNAAGNVSSAEPANIHAALASLTSTDESVLLGTCCPANRNQTAPHSFPIGVDRLRRGELAGRGVLFAAVQDYLYAGLHQGQGPGGVGLLVADRSRRGQYGSKVPDHPSTRWPV
jgi:hypothetical protein